MPGDRRTVGRGRLALDDKRSEPEVEPRLGEDESFSERDRASIQEVERLAEDRERIAALGLCASVADAKAAMHAARNVVRRGAGASAQAALLHELFIPFRSVFFEPASRTPLVLALARSAYAERELPSGRLDPGWLAILADALEEAGCAAPELLAHLRSGGEHVRGCWAVDAVLGAE